MDYVTITTPILGMIIIQHLSTIALDIPEV